MTRLLWFRENMPATLRLYLLCEFPEPPGCAWSRPLLSLDVRQPVGLGISRSRVPKLRPRRRHLGWAGRGTLLQHPRQRPGRPGQSRGTKQAWPDNPTARHPTLLKHCGGASSGRAQVSWRLTWGRGGPREAPPRQPPPPGKPHSLCAENPVATWVTAWHPAVLAGPRDRPQFHAKQLLKSWFQFPTVPNVSPSRFRSSISSLPAHPPNPWQ